MTRVAILIPNAQGDASLIAVTERDSESATIYLATKKASCLGTRWDPQPMPAAMRDSLKALGMFVPLVA